MDLGPWISDLGSWISDLSGLGVRSRISDFGIPDLGQEVEPYPGVPDLRSRISDLGSRISDLRFRISDLGGGVSSCPSWTESWISDFGLGLERVRKNIAPQLDFGHRLSGVIRPHTRLHLVRSQGTPPPSTHTPPLHLPTLPHSRFRTRISDLGSRISNLDYTSRPRAMSDLGPPPPLPASSLAPDLDLGSRTWRILGGGMARRPAWLRALRATRSLAWKMCGQVRWSSGSGL